MIIKEVLHEELRPLFFLNKEQVDFKPNPRTRYLGVFIDGKIIGCVGWQKIGSVLRYKSDGIIPKYRGRGIYSKLWKERERVCSKIPRSKITAFCTEMSLPKYLKEGFFRISKRNNITFVEK